MIFFQILEVLMCIILILFGACIVIGFLKAIYEEIKGRKNGR